MSSVEQQMLEQLAKTFRGQKLPPISMGNFDVPDGRHMGEVIDTGTRITANGYFQFFIQFRIFSDAGKGATPYANYNLPDPEKAKAILADDEEEKQRKLIPLAILTGALVRILGDAADYSTNLPGLFGALGSEDLRLKLLGKRAELNAKHGTNGMLQLQVRRGVGESLQERRPMQPDFARVQPVKAKPRLSPRKK